MKKKLAIGFLAGALTTVNDTGQLSTGVDFSKGPYGSYKTITF